MTEKNYAFALVQQYFRFLFDDGFTLVEISDEPKAFGNWLIVLRSNNLTIELREDRGQVMLACGPVSVQTARKHVQCVDLDFAIGFLRNDPDIDLKESFPHSINSQMEELAEKLRSKYQEIIQLFSSNVYPLKEKELESYWRKMTDKYLESFKVVRAKKRR